VRDALAAWDFDCPSGLDGVDPETATPVSGDAAAASIGCAAFHVLLPRLVDGAMADELASSDLIARPFLVSFVNLVLRPDALQMGADWWDDVSTDEPEDMAAIVAAAMNDAGAFLETTLGDDPDTWRWGRLHTVTLRANLFDDAGIPNFNNGPYVNDGGWFTVDVANPSGMYRDDYAHRSGASMRFACDLPADAPVACTLQVPGGNVHFRDDPHYDDQLKKWLVNEPFDLHFTADAVLGHTERIVRFEVVP
jgi:acyl-homoserine lactone acylase PvdQ